MKKAIFKKEYSSFRKELRQIYSSGQREKYIEFFANSEFAKIRNKQNLPVSIKIELYKRGLLKLELRNLRGVIC